MAISRLTGQDAVGTSTTTSVSATYAATPTAGNTLIASVYSNIGTLLATISGWTQVVTDSFDGGVRGIQVFAKVATGLESTTVTASGATLASRMSMHIYEYSGLLGTLTTDGTGSNDSGISNVNTLTTATLTTTNANDLIFVAQAFNGASGTASFSNSFTALSLDGITSLNDANLIVSSTGPYVTVVSTASTGRQGTVIAAFKAANPSTANTGFFNFM